MCVILKRWDIACIGIVTHELLPASADFIFPEDYELSFFEETLQE